MSEKPGRYQRSSAGMIGAMIVTVLCVLAFVSWRALFRSEGEAEVVPVEWRERVQIADGAGLRIVRPRELPDGWVATSADLRAGDQPRWGLGVLTDDRDFVGIRQEDTSVAELLRTYVDKDAVAGEDASVESDVSDTWQTWSDDGGDLGYSTEVGEDTVLVYGSAPAADIEDFIALLTLPEE